MIPIQFGSEFEAIAFTDIGDYMYETTTLISGGNAIVSIIMQTSLNSLWSTINS